MQISVLGPLVVDHDGHSLVPTAAKPRQVLACLAMQPGHLVTLSTLMEELWGERLPSSAGTTLQTYVLQIRKLLASAIDAGSPAAGLATAHDILETRPAGYVLNPSEFSFDAGEFEQQADAGQAALAAGRPDEAGARLGQALGMWRGAALLDVNAGPVLSIEVTRLEQMRLSAVESRLAADLHRGLHATVLGELTALTARNRYHEGLHAQLMIALHRCGRPFDALEVFRRLRTAMVTDLGLEPSLRMQRLHQAVLAGADELEATPARPAAQHAEVFELRRIAG